MTTRRPQQHGHGHGHGHGHTAEHLELGATAAGVRATWISLVALGLTAAAQGVIVFWTGSVALLSDTVHNVADALTAVPLLVAFGLAARAATARHTYGYGRAEDIAGIIIVAVIVFSALFAAVEALRRLADPEPVRHLAAVAAAGAIGFVGNEAVATYRIRIGRRIGSAALVADGLHARTDGFTSLAVLVSAGGLALGWDWADPVIALAISVAILGVLRSAVRQVGARLMDAVDPELSDRARRTLVETPGVEGVRELRLRWIGHSLRAEADLELDGTLTLTEAHRIAHRAEAALRTALPRLTAATVHVGPAGMDHSTLATAAAGAPRAGNDSH